MFNDGFNPVKQWMIIVEVSATTDASDAAVSCRLTVSLVRTLRSRNSYDLPK
jgi:hypothetical protein